MARQESQRKRLPFPEIPEEILSFIGCLAEGIEYVGYCKALSAIEVVNLLRISSSIDREKNNFGS